MGATGSRASHRSMGRYGLAGGLALAAAAAMLIATQPAGAAATPVGLGAAAPFAVLAGTTVTNTGPTVVNGDLGVSPGSAVTGFFPTAGGPGTVNGTQHIADTAAANAQLALTAAYTTAVGETPATTIPTELGSTTQTPGVYNSAAGTFGITGTLTLNAQGDPNAIFVFQTATTLTTAAASNVVLIGGAQACNVFWQIGSSAALGTTSTLVGNILALTSITATTGAIIVGRALARNGAVTLDTNTITAAGCAATTGPGPAPTPTPTPARSTPAPTPAPTPARPPGPAPAPSPARGTFPVTG